jgi:alpha-methylacyl-CoA racemase
MAGPLDGVKIVELAGIGPSPYACMLLADLGADILRLERGDASKPLTETNETLNRSRYSVAVDLKSDAGKKLVLELCSKADVLIEGFRPGVTERLGLGPKEALAVNPKLVYARMTGFGQEGPLSQRAGHDINYIAVSGALWPMGRTGEKPVPPLNLVGDFGGGSLFLALGVVSALLHARTTGEGQVVDAAMVDGSASMLAMLHWFQSLGFWNEERGTNLLDTGAHFYEVYETSDAKYMAVGAIEPQFYALLLDGLGLSAESLPAQMDRSQWPVMKKRFADIFATKTRDEWTEIFESVDACTTPVLSPSEAVTHRYNSERNVYDSSEAVQPNPAPRFSKTPGAISRSAQVAGSGTRDGLASWGYSDEAVRQLEADGAFG